MQPDLDGAAARAELAEWLGIEAATLRELPQRSVDALLGLIETVTDQGMRRPFPGPGMPDSGPDAAAAAGARDSEGRGRDRAADVRDAAAEMRDREADANDATAEGLDRTAGRRAANHRQQAADERSSAAWGRAEAAEQRAMASSDREGSARNVAADLRDRDAQAKDAAADLSDRVVEQGVAGGLRDAAAGRARAASARAETAADRTQASSDRKIAAYDRAQAARDRESSGTDELTGVHRRGVGLAAVQREIDRARRTGAELVAAYIDVDGLKTENDVRGHAAGDSLIVAVANSLRSSLRTYDVITRVGGDEFVCVLAGIPMEAARQRFVTASATLEATRPGSSITVGFAELGPEDSAGSLIERADGDLLRSRSHR